ncbi:hypothetical protein COU75_04935 [Candidatus Peregrinibacteria bacterium CG10_big_fil_rev_8_21_14_0_10_42_8]|nr:MAG: hypothetical protein COU75_04935 [Candidatus Peregrinibacteria bacterium CG10_big_fil_rev_8_21_14_0_10_42_8]
MRIAFLSPAITEILFALQLQNQLVCTDQFSDYPDEAQRIPHVSDAIYEDIRELYDYDADVAEMVQDIYMDGLLKSYTDPSCELLNLVLL